MAPGNPSGGSCVTPTRTGVCAMRIAWALLAASVVLVDSSPAWAQSVGPELPATATAAPVAPVTGTAGSPARGAQTAVRDAEAAPLP